MREAEKLREFCSKWSDDHILSNLAKLSTYIEKGDVEGAISIVNDVALSACSVMKIYKGPCPQLMDDSQAISAQVWFDDDFATMKSLVRYHLRNYRKSCSNDDRLVYVGVRNIYNNLIKCKKVAYYQEISNKLVKASLTNKRDFWSYFKSAKTRDNPIDPRTWVDHYNSLLNKDYAYDDEPLNWNQFVHRKVDSDSVLNDEISTDEVYAAIASMRNKKAVGEDGIPNEFYKYSPPILAQKINGAI